MRWPSSFSNVYRAWHEVVLQQRKDHDVPVKLSEFMRDNRRTRGEKINFITFILFCKMKVVRDGEIGQETAWGTGTVVFLSFLDNSTDWGVRGRLSKVYITRSCLFAAEPKCHSSKSDSYRFQCTIKTPQKEKAFGFNQCSQIKSGSLIAIILFPITTFN